MTPREDRRAIIACLIFLVVLYVLVAWLVPGGWAEPPPLPN